MFYVNIIIYLKLQLPPATCASCPVRDLSSPRVDNRRVGVSASCPVTVHKLVCTVAHKNRLLQAIVSYKGAFCA